MENDSLEHAVPVSENADRPAFDAELAEGQRHLAHGDLVNAVRCFGSVLLRDRGNTAALRGLGRCALLDGHLDTADLCFARAEALTRESGSVPGSSRR